MESEDEAQERINRHHEEVARKKREALYAQYMARVALFDAAFRNGDRLETVSGFTPNS